MVCSTFFLRLSASGLRKVWWRGEAHQVQAVQIGALLEALAGGVVFTSPSGRVEDLDAVEAHFVGHVDAGFDAAAVGVLELPEWNTWRRRCGWGFLLGDFDGASAAKVARGGGCGPARRAAVRNCLRFGFMGCSLGAHHTDRRGFVVQALACFFKRRLKPAPQSFRGDILDLAYLRHKAGPLRPSASRRSMAALPRSAVVEASSG